jgi:hypothetical protein
MLIASNEVLLSKLGPEKPAIDPGKEMLCIFSELLPVSSF